MFRHCIKSTFIFLKIKGSDFIKIKIVDSIMGSGKTEAIIQRIIDNKDTETSFIYVTPYLDEVDRVVSRCKENGIPICVPDAKAGRGRKLVNFKELIKNKKNIITTHALIDRIDTECLDLFKQNEYILYMDEVHNVVDQYSISMDDLIILHEQKLIDCDLNTTQISWTDNNYNGKYNEIKNLCQLGSLYARGNNLYLWTFPVKLFTHMKEIYVLTYLFNGQIQKYYYDIYNIEYEYYGVKKENDKYVLCEYDTNKRLQDIREYSNLIHTYQGDMNLEQYTDSLSSSWYEKHNKRTLSWLKNNITNWFINITKGKSEDNMWTTLKSKQNILKGNGYTKGFVELNSRSTNKYRNKKYLAYLYNRYLNPIEKQFFIFRKAKIDEEAYALSELLQWIFRSQIRDKKPIELYLPSKRMRTLLEKWEEIASR